MYRLVSESLTNKIWQFRNSPSLRGHRTSTLRPWGNVFLANSASTVPNRKSPTTQIRNGAVADENALSGQSMKLGNFARKLAFVRYSTETEVCALTKHGAPTSARTRANVAVKPLGIREQARLISGIPPLITALRLRANANGTSISQEFGAFELPLQGDPAGADVDGARVTAPASVWYFVENSQDRTTANDSVQFETSP